MSHAQYETTTDVPAEKLFRAISDINTNRHTLLSRKPALTAKSTIRPRRAGNFGKSRSCSSQVIG
jgi:hypothetical protein